MKLSKEAISSFKNIYLNKCGIELSDNEAETKALYELKQFSLVYKQIPTGHVNIKNKVDVKNNSN